MIMICPRSWFLSLKHTTLEEEKTVGLEQNRTHISHRTWNIYQGICDRTQTTNSTVEAFATQCEAQLQTCTQSLETDASPDGGRNFSRKSEIPHEEQKYIQHYEGDT